MAIILGLAVACAYGGADFLGGLTSRRSGVLAVIATSQAVGLAAIALVLAAGPESDPAGRDLALGVAVGVTGCVAVSLLYRGLAVGRMSVVAPLTAVGSAVLPVAWGVVGGERPSAVAAAGVVLAVLAVVLVAGSSQDGGDATVAGARPAVPPRLELALAAGAGVGFGTGFVLLAETGDGAGMWPIGTSRLTSLALILAAGLVLRRGVVARADRRLVALSGLLDVAANAFFLAASRSGLLSVVAPLAALYPAGTVLLARVVLGERLSRTQLAGLAAGGAGVLMIAIG